jgi:hypothetical protein
MRNPPAVVRSDRNNVLRAARKKDERRVGVLFTYLIPPDLPAELNEEWEYLRNPPDLPALSL